MMKKFFIRIWRRTFLYKSGALFILDKDYYENDIFYPPIWTFDKVGIIIKKVPFLCIYYVYLNNKFGFLEAEVIKVLK